VKFLCSSVQKKICSEILTQDIRAGKNPYLVKIYGYIRTRKMLGIVLEYMEKGSLFDLLHKRKERLSQLQRVRMGRHCALGLAYLHTKNVIHRDIKSMNILVSNDYKCKITGTKLSYNYVYTFLT